MGEGSPRVSFIADNNVGKLAKWLRVMGYDTLFIDPIEDEGLIRLALAEGRVVLTRDTSLGKRRLATSGKLKVILVQGDDFRGQLRQVVETLGLDSRAARFSLCIQCNEALIPQSKEEVQGRVPPYVFATQEQYRLCPRCGRIYWRGTHWVNMGRELDRILEEP